MELNGTPAAKFKKTRYRAIRALCKEREWTVRQLYSIADMSRKTITDFLSNPIFQKAMLRF